MTMTIDLNPNIEKNKNNKNYATPETKEKNVENISDNLKDINEEKNQNSLNKEFPKFENEDINFPDFNPVLNEEEKIDDKNIIIFNNNINIIRSDNDNNIEPNKQINKNKNKKVKYNLPSEKLYNKFINKLKNKLPIDDKNIISHKKEMDNSKINNDINVIQNKIKHLKECYLNLIVKAKKLKSKNDIKKLEQDIDISTKEKELEQNLDNLLSEINIKEKENDKNFYYIKIKNIFEKFKRIKMQEISQAENKLERNELYLPKYKKENSIEMNKNQEERNIKEIYSIIILIISAFIFCIHNTK